VELLRDGEKVAKQAWLEIDRRRLTWSASGFPRQSLSVERVSS